MKANEMKIGSKYTSTAFKRPVKLVSIDYIGADNDANVTVEYYGRLYTDCSFRMREYHDRKKK